MEIKDHKLTGAPFVEAHACVKNALTLNGKS